MLGSKLKTRQVKSFSALSLQENADDCGGASFISPSTSVSFMCLLFAAVVSWWRITSLFYASSYKGEDDKNWNPWVDFFFNYWTDSAHFAHKGDRHNLSLKTLDVMSSCCLTSENYIWTKSCKKENLLYCCCHGYFFHLLFSYAPHCISERKGTEGWRLAVMGVNE